MKVTSSYTIWFKDVLEGGGELVARKVDCAIERNPVRADCDDTNWGGYRMCDVPKINRTEIIDNVPFTHDDDWTDYDNDDRVMTGKNNGSVRKTKGIIITSVRW